MSQQLARFWLLVVFCVASGLLVCEASRHDGPISGKGRARQWKSAQRQLQRSEAVAALQTSLKPFHDFQSLSTGSSSSSGFSMEDHFGADSGSHSSFESGIHHHHGNNNNNNPFEENDFMGAELKPSGHECQDIRIDVCRGIGYNVTSMPNFVGQELQSDAELQLQSFMPLVQYGCSSQLLFFLCSVYTPMCTEKVAVIIGPCRPLCESVRSRCAPVLQELGFPWPSALNCSKFVPVNTIDHMCMEGPPPEEPEDLSSYSSSSSSSSLNKDTRYPDPLNPLNPLVVPSRDLLPQPPPPPPPPPPQPQPQPQPPLFDKSPSINGQVPPGPGHHYPINHFPSHHHNPKSEFELGEDILGSSLSRDEHSSNINNKRCTKYRHPQHYVFLEHPRGRCVSRCTADVLFTAENKQFVDYWTSVWAFLSLVSCCFTLVTFILGPQQFRYPERAIVYIAACYSIYSLAYIYRAVVGRATLSCYQESTNDVSLLVQEGAYNFHCTLSFVMLYYFGMAGAAWWLILAITWSLSTAFGLSATRLSKHGQLYHSIAWVLPALQTLAVLVMRAVDADELTGTCFVGNQDESNLLKFVIIPMTFYSGTGIVLIFSSLLFVRYCTIHEPCDDEFADQCCCSHGSGSSDSSNGDTEPDTEPSSTSLHDSPTTTTTTITSSTTTSNATTGCGNFCRRLRNSCSSVGSSSNHGHHHHHHQHHHHLRPAGGQTGSGHSLLLPPIGQNVNFCSTVSSTSSYSSSSAASSKGQNVLLGPLSSAGRHRCPHQQCYHQHSQHANANRPHQLFQSSNHKPLNLTGVENPAVSSHLLLQSSNNNNNNKSCRASCNEKRIGSGGRFHFRRAHCATAHHHTALRSPFSGSLPGSSSSSSPSSKDHAILVRSGIFALFYTLPAICVLLSCVYEYTNRNSWLRFVDEPAQHQQQSHNFGHYNNQNQEAPPNTMEPETSRPNFEIFSMKLFMSLVIGIKTGIWILTAKNPINTWRCMFSRCFMKKQVGVHFMNTAMVPSGGGGPGIHNLAQNAHHHHLQQQQQQQKQQQHHQLQFQTQFPNQFQQNSISGGGGGYPPNPNANLNLNFNLSQSNPVRTQPGATATQQPNSNFHLVAAARSQPPPPVASGDRFFFSSGVQALATGVVAPGQESTGTISQTTATTTTSRSSSSSSSSDSNQQRPSINPTNPFQNAGVYQQAQQGVVTSATPFVSNGLFSDQLGPSAVQQPLLQPQFRTGNETAV